MIISIAFFEGMYKSYANHITTLIPGADTVINRLIDTGHVINIICPETDYMLAHTWFEQHISILGASVNAGDGDCMIHPLALGAPTICPFTGPRYINWSKVEEMLVEKKILAKYIPEHINSDYEGDAHG